MQIALPTSLSFGIFNGNRHLLFHLRPVSAWQETRLGACSSLAVCMEPLRPFGLFCMRYLRGLGELCTVSSLTACCLNVRVRLVLFACVSFVTIINIIETNASNRKQCNVQVITKLRISVMPWQYEIFRHELRLCQRRIHSYKCAIIWKGNI